MAYWTQTDLAAELGCSIKTIERAVANGRLSGALDANNRVADMGLAKKLMSISGNLNGQGHKFGTKMAKPDETAIEATLRKEQATLEWQERALLDERGELLETRLLLPWYRKVITAMADALNAHIEDIAALAGNREPPATVRHIREGVARALASAQAAPRPKLPTPDAPRPAPFRASPQSPSEALMRVRVRKQRVAATAAELRNSIQAGEYLRADAFLAQINDRLIAGRAVLMNVHSGVLSTLTIGDVRSLLNRRFGECVACWRGQADVTFADEEKKAPRPPRPAGPITATLRQLTAEFNDLVPQAAALGIAWARTHSSDFGDKAGAVKQIEKLRAEIADRRVAQ